MYVYFGDNTTKYMTASTREARVVDEIRFSFMPYYGRIGRKQSDFKLNVNF